MHPMPGTFNLPGPSTLSYEYMLTLVSTITYNPPSRAPIVPKSVALALAKAAQSLWWPMLSPDEVIRRYIDDAEVPGDWDKFGVIPDEIEEHAITYLRRYRSAYVSARLFCGSLQWFIGQWREAVCPCGAGFADKHPGTFTGRTSRGRWYSPHPGKHLR